MKVTAFYGADRNQLEYKGFFIKLRINFIDKRNEKIKAIDPNASITSGNIRRLENQLEKLEKQLEGGKQN
jgi:hypothetical protein